MKVNCLDLEIATMKYFGVRKNLIVNNITNWSNLVNFETDIIVLTNSDLAYGFEIKISLSDLKADFKKVQFKNRLKDYCKTNPASKTFFGKFKHFSYICPEELKDAAINIIPEWAGLYCFRVFSINNIEKSSIYEVRKPKKLFTYKWKESERYQLARLGAMRILGLKEKIKSHERI